MSLNSNALISVNTFKALINKDVDSTVNDERYELFINDASQQIENYCRRKFRQPSIEFTETIDGNGRTSLRLLYWPVTTSPTTINYYDAGSETYVALTSPDFQVNTDEGIITFMDGNKWTKGIRNWQVSYIYGYSLSSMPADLRNACAQLAKAIQNVFDENLHDVSSVSYDGGSTSYMHGDESKAFPPFVLKVLMRYRSYRRIVNA